ncbi:SMI1/KNR4 family protein [Prosthecobacter sp.]|uniref:SMI1/KNR4 family protein n=1 Tax=Prosthecobacter sp. TaxID=1965333 RepID=UPI003783BA7B
MLDPRIEPATPFTETDLATVERVLGQTLPTDYRDFACLYGGAYVGGLIDGDPKLPISAFLDAGSVLSTLEICTDLKEDGVLPVADCVLGNLYVIDRGGAVHYINYYGGKTTSRMVADTFGEMLHRIVVSDR